MNLPLARNETQGACWNCHLRFVWTPPPRLKTAHCPNCGRKLKRTTYKTHLPTQKYLPDSKEN